LTFGDNVCGLRSTFNSLSATRPTSHIPVPFVVTDVKHKVSSQLLLYLLAGIRWRWVVSFKPQPFYCRGKSPKYPFNKRLSGHQSWSGHFAQKICCPDRNQIPGPSACSV